MLAYCIEHCLGKFKFLFLVTTLLLRQLSFQLAVLDHHCMHTTPEILHVSLLDARLPVLPIGLRIQNVKDIAAESIDVLPNLIGHFAMLCGYQLVDVLQLFKSLILIFCLLVEAELDLIIDQQILSVFAQVFPLTIEVEELRLIVDDSGCSLLMRLIAILVFD